VVYILTGVDGYQLHMGLGGKFIFESGAGNFDVYQVENQQRKRLRRTGRGLRNYSMGMGQRREKRGRY